MVLGVSMARRCPDQTATEAARKKYVAEALRPTPIAVSQPAKKVVQPKKESFFDSYQWKRWSSD